MGFRWYLCSLCSLKTKYRVKASFWKTTGTVHFNLLDKMLWFKLKCTFISENCFSTLSHSIVSRIRWPNMGILRTAAEGGAEGGMKGSHASRLPPPLYSKMATVDYDSSADPEMDLTSDEELERYLIRANTLIRCRPVRLWGICVLGTPWSGSRLCKDPEIATAA